jgi:hypothetical protein
MPRKTAPLPAHLARLTASSFDSFAQLGEAIAAADRMEAQRIAAAKNHG